MKIGMFTDSHYSSAEVTCGNRYNSKSLEKIRNACKVFAKEKCDLVISLGDLTDREDSHQKELENLKAVADVINNLGIKTICLMGNHDGFCYTEDEFYGALPLSKPQNMSLFGVNLVFVDACYFKNGKHYAPGDSDWTDTFFPHTSELSAYLDKCTDNTYVFMHQNVDKSIQEDHRLSNAAELCDIFEKCGKVKKVFQGHYHPGKSSLHNGIEYVTLPAMCTENEGYFIFEL